MIQNSADDLVILEEIGFAWEFFCKFLEWEVISIIFQQVFDRNNVVFYPVIEMYSFIIHKNFSVVK